MRRIFGGASDGFSNSDSELCRLVNGATIPPYDELSTHPYSAQIQFATQHSPGSLGPVLEPPLESHLRSQEKETLGKSYRGVT